MSAPECLEVSLDSDAQSYMLDVAAALPDELRVGQEATAIQWAVDRLNTTPPTAPLLQDLGKNACLDLVVVHGLIIDQTIPSPETYPQQANVEMHPFDIQHLLLDNSFGGKPFGSPSLRNGCLTTDIFPQERHADTPDSGLSSREPLDWHIDGALRPEYKPDWISLLPIRNEEQAETITAAVNDTDLSQNTLELLSQPAFKLGGKSEATPALPIIREVASDGRCLLYSAGTGDIKIHAEGTVSENDGRRALNELRGVLNDPASQTKLVLEPGQLLYLNNGRQVHSRVSFMPHRNPGLRRWLRRYYLKVNA